ncbi:uncharacterized protein, partial [Diadema setosum]|uniref:uncharacterized protein n=1 Tax=Diadema setosum TaxID=31175 RepID=UPI003B3A4F45
NTPLNHSRHGQSSEFSLDNTLKHSIERQIALSRQSPDLVKKIATEIFDVIAAQLEERITSKVYQAVSLDLKKCEHELRSAQQKVTEMEKQIKRLRDENDDAKQYSRRNCFMIYGVREQSNENTDKLVLDIFNSKLGLNVPTDAIDRSHRITPRQKQDGDKVDPPSRDRHQQTSYASAVGPTRKPRVIIVKFSRYNARNDVYRARTRLKDLSGPKLFIREDLTSKNAALYWKVIESKKAKTCWTQDGAIFALNQDGRRIRIVNEHDIEKL